MSLALRILNVWLRNVEKPALARITDPGHLRRSFERKAKIFFRMPRGIFKETRHYAGRQTLCLRPGSGERGAAVLYFHGGAYIFGSPYTHAAMLGRLSKNAGCSVFLPSYRLAPEHPFPAAVEDALAVYSEIVEKHGRVFLGGDSAGGGLVFALLARVLDQGIPPPLGCFAFSPLTDMTFSGESLQLNAHREAVLPSSRINEMKDMYLAGHDPHDPGASPLFASFKAAPPVWLTAGTTEILLDDTRRFAAHLADQGVQVEHSYVDDHPHVWPIFQSFLPEARHTLHRVADWKRGLDPQPS